jgi:hypothetical protein
MASLGGAPRSAAARLLAGTRVEQFRLVREVGRPACTCRSTASGSSRDSRDKSSRVLQEVIRQAPAGYVTVGWLTSTLHRHSFGIIMLALGLVATTPVGSTVPGLILAVIAVQLIVGRTEPVFPHFIMTRHLPTKQLLRLGGRAIHVLKYLEKVVHPRWPMTSCTMMWSEIIRGA